MELGNPEPTLVGQAAPGQSPPKPLLRPALLRADQAKPAEAAALRPAGGVVAVVPNA